MSRREERCTEVSEAGARCMLGGRRHLRNASGDFLHRVGPRFPLVGGTYSTWTTPAMRRGHGIKWAARHVDSGRDARRKGRPWTLGQVRVLAGRGMMGAEPHALTCADILADDWELA